MKKISNYNYFAFIVLLLSAGFNIKGFQLSVEFPFNLQKISTKNDVVQSISLTIIPVVVLLGVFLSIIGLKANPHSLNKFVSFLLIIFSGWLMFDKNQLSATEKMLYIVDDKYRLAKSFMFSDVIDKSDTKAIEYFEQFINDTEKSNKSLATLNSESVNALIIKPDSIKLLHAKKLLIELYIGNDIYNEFGFDLINQIIEQDDSAQYKLYLGMYYAKSKGSNKDNKKAIKIWKDLSSDGNLWGMYNLAVHYKDGLGVDKNFKLALKWFKKAAENGHMDSQYFLGKQYYEGKKVKKNLIRAKEYFKLAADQGHADAQNYMGVFNHNGIETEQNYKLARNWYIKAADQGEEIAQSNLGKLYYYGLGLEKNFEQAVFWFRKSSAQGYAEAQSYLGRAYDNGRGLKKDSKMAITWLTKAANKGYVSAMKNLGIIYYHGRKDLNKDYILAKHWFSQAAERDNAKAQYYIGEHYFHGNGVVKSYSIAKKWYERAAKQEYADAELSLGYLYKHGKGVKKNIDNAIAWYKKATDHGNPYALYEIGWLNFITGKKKTAYKAFKNYLKHKNHWAAHQNLAHIELIKGNKDEAIALYKLSMSLADENNELDKFWQGYDDDYKHIEQYRLDKKTYMNIKSKLRSQVST